MSNVPAPELDGLRLASELANEHFRHADLVRGRLPRPTPTREEQLDELARLRANNDELEASLLGEHGTPLSPRERAMREYRTMRQIAGELPDVDAVASLFAQAFHQLYSAFDQHHDALRTVLGFELEPDDEAEVMAYATEVVARATEIAALVTVAAQTTLLHEQRHEVEPLRSVVMAVTGAADIDADRQSERVRRYVWPD